jgi:hypothetical protein
VNDFVTALGDVSVAYTPSQFAQGEALLEALLTEVGAKVVGHGCLLSW